MITTCDVGAMIASSHTMMISATLFTDKFINTVIKYFLLLLFHYLIAFSQFLINEYFVMLCYDKAATIATCPWYRRKVGLENMQPKCPSVLVFT